MNMRLLPDAGTMHRALVDRDPSFEGQFFIGVTSTGIFCRPTCTARKPRRENVEFFAIPAEALHAGYRACRLCRPLEPPQATPGGIRRLLAEVVADPTRRLTDADRRMLSTQLERIRRRFRVPLVPGSHPQVDLLREELERYFAGDLRQFEIPLDLRGTPFQQRVWEVLRKIPYGETRSYADQARLLGEPGAVRAVARANATTGSRSWCPASGWSAPTAP
jgi:methylphosphotriester-DNA--protein-cysteine methyltransferase